MNVLAISLGPTTRAPVHIFLLQLRKLFSKGTSSIFKLSKRAPFTKGMPEFVYFLKWFLKVNLNFRDEVENPLVFVWKQQVFRICCCVEHVAFVSTLWRSRAPPYATHRTAGGCSKSKTTARPISEHLIPLVPRRFHLRAFALEPSLAPIFSSTPGFSREKAKKKNRSAYLAHRSNFSLWCSSPSLACSWNALSNPCLALCTISSRRWTLGRTWPSCRGKKKIRVLLFCGGGEWPFSFHMKREKKKKKKSSRSKKKKKKIPN